VSDVPKLSDEQKLFYLNKYVELYSGKCNDYDIATFKKRLLNCKLKDPLTSTTILDNSCPENIKQIIIGPSISLRDVFNKSIMCFFQKFAQLMTSSLKLIKENHKSYIEQEKKLTNIQEIFEKFLEECGKLYTKFAPTGYINRLKMDDEIKHILASYKNAVLVHFFNEGADVLTKIKIKVFYESGVFKEKEFDLLSFMIENSSPLSPIMVTLRPNFKLDLSYKED